MTTVDRCPRLRNMYSLVCRLVLLTSLPVFSQTAQLSVEPGVVVVGVTKGSEAEKAGLQAGEVILAWSRSDSHGNIESPFDLNEIEIEQGPRGSVLLEGLRGRDKQTWRMGPNDWGLTLLPAFTAAPLAGYQKCSDRS